MSGDSELTVAQKIRQAALREAAEYHARLANTPTATAGASAAKVTATAQEFVNFLEKVVERADVSPGELDKHSARQGKLS